MDAIAATDDELRAVLAEAEIPPLLPALAYVTGDLSLLRDDLRPDPMLIALPQGGMSAAQQDTARAVAFDALVRFRDGGCRVAPAAAPRRPAPHRRVRRRWRRTGRVPAPAGGGARAPGRRPAGAAVAQGRPRPRHRLPCRGHRRRDVGPADRVPPPPGRHRGRDPREERGRRWHLVREPVSGVPGRQPEPQLQLLVRTAPRLAAALLRPRTCSSTTSGTARRSSAYATAIRFGTEVSSATWNEDDAAWTLVVAHARRDRGDAHRERGRERGGSAQPPALPRHPRTARPSPGLRSTRPAGSTTRRSTAPGSR